MWLLGRGDLGRITEGSYADLLVLDGNPFDEPSILWDESKTRTVIKDGRIVSTDALRGAAGLPVEDSAKASLGATSGSVLKPIG